MAPIVVPTAKGGIHDEIGALLGTVQMVRIAGAKKTRVRLVNGEESFNEPSLSAGFVHFEDPDTGENKGHAGIVTVLRQLQRNKKKG